jgi:hypothetical protein
MAHVHTYIGEPIVKKAGDATACFGDGFVISRAVYTAIMDSLLAVAEQSKLLALDLTKQ